MSLAELEGAYQASEDGRGDERLPPQDVGAEQSVLGGMLLSKDAIADCVEAVRGSDFYRPAHELIWDAVLDLYGRGEPADAITVADELTKRGELSRVGGQAYLHQLIQGVPTAANAGYYAQIVAERAVLRRLVEAGTRIAQMGYATGGGDVVDLVNAAQAEVYSVADKRGGEDYVRLGEIIEATADEIEAASSTSGEMAGVPTGFTDLDQLTNGLHPGQMIVVAARPAVGKALALDTPLPTPQGWTTMREVQVGDQLIDRDGKPTTVVAATEVLTGRPCYEVEFCDGTVIVADEQHQWLTETRTDLGRRRDQQDVVAQVRTTAEIADTLRTEMTDRGVNHAVTLSRGLDLPEQDLPLPPYVVGAGLGQGGSAAAQLPAPDPQLVMLVEAEGLQLVPVGAGTRYDLHFPAAPSAEPVCPRCGGFSGSCDCASDHADRGTVSGCLRELGILGDPHIPAQYQRASRAQREALLAGLLDAEGTVTASGRVRFTTGSSSLAAGVRELVAGLGYRVDVAGTAEGGQAPESSTAFTVTFFSDEDVFRLERKRLLHKECRARAGQRPDALFVVDVRPVASVPVRCVEVDNDQHLYLASHSMVPTHNSTLGLDIARAAAVKHNQAAVVFSLEMSKTEITMRLLSAEAGIQLQHMRKGSMRDEDWTKLAATMGRVSESPLFIDDSPNMSLMEIRAKCRRLKQTNNLKLVIIDYLQLMTSGKRVESRQQEVAEFSRALKLLAKELDVPVIAISQLNRGPEQRTDKRPQMSDLRESGSIEQDADMVILLHREDSFNKESERAGEADLIVAKHRNGPTDNIVLAFQGHYSRFTNMAQSF